MANVKVSFLEGKKTYLIALVAILVFALQYFNFIESTTAEQIMVLLGFGGLATLRHALTTIK